MIMTSLLMHVAAVGDGCSPKGGSFLGFPTWYKYLPGHTILSGNPGGAQTVCAPALTKLTDIWLIVAAGIEILLRLAALAAIILVLYGGIQFITSEGDPAKTQKARGTVINALVGLVIAVAATTVIAFIAGSFS